MTTQATISSPVPVGLSSSIQPLVQRLKSLLLPTVLLLIALSGWEIHHRRPYLSGSDLGYSLGLIGGLLMLALLLYPLRKRIRFLQIFGPLRHWFRFHLIAGILGPLLVLYHSAFQVGSFNAAIALASMLLVAASGIVGRFIYRKIHNGLFGSRANLAELQTTLAKELEARQPLLERLPEVKKEVNLFAQLVEKKPEGRIQRAMHFVTLGIKRNIAEFRIHRSLNRLSGSKVDNMRIHLHLEQLVGNITHTLRAVQKTAQFQTYERLFSLWHVVHVPFLCLLLITAIVHVIAVHAY